MRLRFCSRKIPWPFSVLQKILVSFSVMLTATSCGPLFAPSSASDTDSYVIADDGSLPELADYKSDIRLLIRDTQGNSFINSRKIIFARDARTRGYYQLAQWVEPPPRRLSLMLTERLERSESFVSVSGLGSSAIGDWQLNTELTEFYHDISSSPGTVHIRLRADLVDSVDRRVIGERVFEKTVPASSYNAAGAVEALTSGLNELLNELVLWVVELVQLQG